MLIPLVVQSPLCTHVQCLPIQLARRMGIPRVYISSNAGARIGLAREVQAVLRVAFVDKQPSKGIAYLYVSPEDYAKIKNMIAADLAMLIYVRC